MQHIDVIGAACSAGASTDGCEHGPDHLRNSNILQQLPLNLQWKAVLHTDHRMNGLDALPAIHDYCDNVATLVAKAINHQRYFLTVGGDHSCAMGTWSGAAHAIRHQGDLGLIWIDAHIDAHTHETSETGNIHGMPVAHLLGHGMPELSNILDAQPKLKPHNIALIGIRSYESGEQALAKQLGVRVYYIDEVLERGIDVVLPEAYDLISKNTVAMGFSIDIDGFDPKDAPAVGTPVEQGIDAQAFISAYKKLPRTNMLGAEIAEFNPKLDINQKSEHLIAQLIEATFSP